MHGYETFPEDVKRQCKSLMKKYHLHVVSESAVEVELKSELCVVTFVTEYDYVQFMFKQQEEDRWMFVGPYLQAQFPDEKLIMPRAPENFSRVDKVRFSLNANIELIKKYCHPVLKGDFSWRDKYDQREKDA